MRWRGWRRNRRWHCHRHNTGGRDPRIRRGRHDIFAVLPIFLLQYLGSYSPELLFQRLNLLLQGRYRSHAPINRIPQPNIRFIDETICRVCSLRLWDLLLPALVSESHTTTLATHNRLIGDHKETENKSNRSRAKLTMSIFETLLAPKTLWTAENFRGS